MMKVFVQEKGRENQWGEDWESLLVKEAVGKEVPEVGWCKQ